MKRRILCFVLTMAMVLSMLVVVPAVTVSADTYNASDNPVIITTDADWAAFASAVNGGTTFEGKTVKLAGDITVTTAAGCGGDKSFRGNFDGQNHTVTISQSFTGDPDGCSGMFGYVRTPVDGTITFQNVKTTGTITLTGSGNSYICSGFIGGMDANTSGSGGTINISNVWSAVDFNNSRTGVQERFGGIVGFPRHASGVKPITINIDSCVYSGTMTISAGKAVACGGIFGGTGNNVSGRSVVLNVTNCLVSGSFAFANVSNPDDFGVFVGYPKTNASDGTVAVTVKDCISTATYNFMGDWSSCTHYADFGIAYGEVTGNYFTGTVTNLYYVDVPYGDTTLTVVGSSGDSKTTVTNAVAKTLSEIKALTAATVTMTDTSKWYFGTSGLVPVPKSAYDSEFVDASAFADMTQSTFTIMHNADMATFAALVTAGTDFAGKTIKLGANVNLNTTVGYAGSGDDRRWFSGNFDGQGYTVNITQVITDPDYNTAGLFGFVRIPEDSTITIQNVHLTGTITLTYTTSSKGYSGGLIGALDSGKSGSGGTINITNVWNTVTINNSGNQANYIGGFIGFLRHEAGLKQLTINIDSCLWDGILSFTHKAESSGGLVGYTGSQANTRKAYINVTNTVVAGTMAFQNANSDDDGMVFGYLKGNGSNPTDAQVITTVTDVLVTGKMTSTVDIGSSKWLGMWCTSEKNGKPALVTMTRFYYISFNVPGFGAIKIDGGNGSGTSGTATVKTKAEVYEMATSAFGTPAKWNKTSGSYPCPAGIVSTFGSVPSSLTFDAYDIYDEFSIGTDEAMASFASAVNSGKTYEGKTVKLTADVNLTTQIGDTDTAKYFSGNFNGQGHTVTITQTFANPNGFGGLFSMVRVPADSSIAIQNVHLAGTITLTNSTTGKGYIGALISTVDAGTSGSGGTLNVTNVWSTTRINAGASNTWYAISGMIGFVRHAAGLKPITINFDSCLWDGIINAGPALEYSGSFIGYTGNQGNANRPLTLNITNSVLAGTIMLNTAHTDDTGLLTGYLKGNGTNNSTSNVTANFHDIAITGKFTSSVSVTKWCSLYQLSGTTAVDMDNFYYINFTVPGKGAIPVYEGTVTPTGSATEVTALEMYNLPTSSFSDASKWTNQTGYNPCPAGIVSTFGAVPESLTVDPIQFITEIEIGSVAEFLAFRDSVNSGTTYSGKTVLLTADIDLDGEAWVGIGSRNDSKVFSGTFDGQGHTISNLTVAAATSETGGLFCQAGNATIQNFTLTGTITIGTDDETDFLGSVINCVYGNTTLRNVRSLVNFTPAANGKKLYYTGGLVGFIHNTNSTNLTIDGCEYAGNINTGGYTNSVSGILGYTGWGNSGVTKTVTITNTLFTGSINFNDNGYYHNNGGFIGYVKRAENGGTITIDISNSYSAGRLYFRRAAAWDKANCDQCGQLIGCVDADVTLNVSNVTYKEAYLYTQVENEKPVEDSKVVLGEIGLYGSEYSYDTPAEVASMDVTFGKRDVDDQYKGIRFTATFTNVGACTGGGTASANFGIFLMTRETYEILGGAAVTESQLVDNNSVVQVKATKFQNNTSSYVVNAVVFNLNTATRQATELVAIAYAGSDLGTAASTTYNEVFN